MSGVERPGQARRLATTALGAVTRPLRERRFAATAKSATGPLKIEIGGGPYSHEGWLPTDIHWRTPYFLDLMKPWPLHGAEVSHVYGDNVVEHFPIHTVPTMLAHIFDALAPNGRLRLATPDVERIARAYLEQPDLVARHLDHAKSKGYSVHYPVDMLRITFGESEHWLGYCFDFASLSNELSVAGFVDVTRCEVGQSTDPELCNLEARATPTDVATTLVVEAVKPA